MELNYAVIPRDAIGHGFLVIMCEKNVLDRETFSFFSKLVHGELRYCEKYKFCLIRKAPTDHKILLDSA